MCTQYFIIHVFILFLFYVIIRTSFKKGACPKFHFRIVKEALENICYKKELLGIIG